MWRAGWVKPSSGISPTNNIDRWIYVPLTPQKEGFSITCISCPAKMLGIGSWFGWRMVVNKSARMAIGDENTAELSPVVHSTYSIDMSCPSTRCQLIEESPWNRMTVPPYPEMVVQRLSVLGRLLWTSPTWLFGPRREHD